MQPVGLFKMKVCHAILFIPVSVLIIFFAYTSSNAFQADVLPYKISPGEAFIIKVTGTKTSRQPSALLAEKKFYFSSCGEGCFIAIGAVDVKTEPGVYTIKLKVGKKKKNLKLFVKHTIFPTEELTLSEDKVFLSPENLKRAKREDKRLKSIFRMVSDRLWEGGFILPLENDISTEFGIKRIINNKRISVHKGVDIRGKEGEEVKASNDGKVVFSEELFFGGNTIILDHGQRIYTIYMHLSEFNVKHGDIVSKGDIIGFVGSTGRSSGPHLHFGVKVLNINTNPVSFVKMDL
jgi:murein DD-endopeptidase MepM/ murein hydrolase activator NlpD